MCSEACETHAQVGYCARWHAVSTRNYLLNIDGNHIQIQARIRTSVVSSVCFENNGRRFECFPAVLFVQVSCIRATQLKSAFLVPPFLVSQFSGLSISCLDFLVCLFQSPRPYCCMSTITLFIFDRSVFIQGNPEKVANIKYHF